jgi:Zn-dependent protease with chaperone function
VSASVALLVYAVLASVVAPRLLRDRQWTRRSPRVGTMVWLSLSVSVVLSAILAGGALALPALPVETDLAEMLHACALALQQQYSTPGGAAVSAGGAVLASAVLARTGYCLGFAWVVTWRRRSRQRQELGLVARRDLRTGALVLDHATRAAYCVPGRRREVVLTSGALDALEEKQLDVVLAHERAHLRHRHDLVLMLAGALHRAFPVVPVLSSAVEELAQLVEMDADDVAAQAQSRLTLVAALVRLADGAPPVGTLGMGGVSALARVRRLLAPAEPLALRWSALAAAGATVMLLVPLAAVTAPAVAAATMDYCPLQLPT